MSKLAFQAECSNGSGVCPRTTGDHRAGWGDSEGEGVRLTGVSGDCQITESFARHCENCVWTVEKAMEGSEQSRDTI